MGIWVGLSRVGNILGCQTIQLLLLVTVLQMCPVCKLTFVISMLHAHTMKQEAKQYAYATQATRVMEFSALQQVYIFHSQTMYSILLETVWVNLGCRGTKRLFSSEPKSNVFLFLLYLLNILTSLNKLFFFQHFISKSQFDVCLYPQRMQTSRKVL
jgi:hypothetical protein